MYLLANRTACAKKEFCTPYEAKLCHEDDETRGLPAGAGTRDDSLPRGLAILRGKKHKSPRRNRKSQIENYIRLSHEFLNDRRSPEKFHLLKGGMS